MPCFFRRIAEGVFDHEDLSYLTDQLAKYVKKWASQYEFR